MISFLNMNKILRLISRFDTKINNPYQVAIKKAVDQSVLKKEPIQFLLFTCSTINASKMFSVTPTEYVSLDPSGNNLQKDIPALAGMMSRFNKNFAAKVTIIIGNTDPYYIYLQQLKNFSHEEKPIVQQGFIDRWAIYRERLEAVIKQKFPRLPVEILSWYDLEKKIEKERGCSFEEEFNRLYGENNNYFSQADLTFELQQLMKQFVPGGYFASLERPSTELLKDWVLRKFSEYALQGEWLNYKFPNAILIQNEKPSDLRSKMYQPLLQKQTGQMLPVVYFFGVDNKGYV